MALIFGFDIGTTSIGFAVIEHDPAKATGDIKRLGVRIFPEARDPKGAPLNQERRAARMRRRQLRRRRERRRLLGEALSEAGLLPPYGSLEWDGIMKPRNKDDSEKYDPYDLRKRAFKGESLSPYEFGRAIYHLAQRRHFKGRDIDEISDDTESEDRSEEKADADEKKAKTGRDSTIAILKNRNTTIGAWLSERGPHERKRGVHAMRKHVEDEFNKIWEKQKKHLSALQDKELRESIREAIFAQRPVFWRKNTLGECRFVPEAPLCPKGAWLSQQKRMLEKVNNLAVGGSARPLDTEERRAILDRLQTQASMTWGGVKGALKSLYRDRGMQGMEKRLKFNLQEGGEQKLIGNPLEAKLADIFGKDWQTHPRKGEIRDAVHDRLWHADYGEVGSQRVVILPAKERKRRRAKAARGFVGDFGVTAEQAEKLKALKLPTGWEPYSVEALKAFLPHLEDGVRFGTLVSSPDPKWEDWRKETFPGMEMPTGEIRDRLPSPADPEERARIAKLRNPTVARTRNELRKVVNNLIGMFGKPDLIRLELAREVGMSKREREKKSVGMRQQEGRRNKARKALEERRIPNPSRDHIEKWMLWEECGYRCPYTDKPIGFEALFHENEFQVEHIWPRSRSFDDSFRNKTLCHRDENERKGNRIPFEYLGGDEEVWAQLEKRLEGMKANRGGVGMPPGKIKRFLAREIPEGFTERQLNDTGYAAREAVAFLKQLWPDVGPEAPVQAVSGRVTAQLRWLWGLNDILGENGKKTRSDHRHHAIDALAVACAHPGMTQKLSRYWQVRESQIKKNLAAHKPRLDRPWETIRTDAEKSVADIVVSHRVRKKVSGPLHRNVVWGDTKREETGKDGITYRYFVTRKKVEDLSKTELEDIRDEDVRKILRDWVEQHGGDPKKSFSDSYPKRGRNGPEIRKVRLLKKLQSNLAEKVTTGYADKYENHHMAIYRLPDGKVDFEVVSLFKAYRRLARGEDVVLHRRDDVERKYGKGATFRFSLSQNDVVELRKSQEKGRWVVHGIKSEGRPVLARLNDARPTAEPEARKRGMDGKRKDFTPRFGGFMKRCPRKISVDPIGRVRPAKD